MPLISVTSLKMLKAKGGNENISFMALNLLGHNNFCSVGVYGAMLITFVDIDWLIFV